MYVLKGGQMRNADAMASEKYGLPGIVLMENAARAVFEQIMKNGYDEIVVVCGGGNNGGDGFALARLLSTAGMGVRVFCFSDKNRIKGDAAINLNILDKMGLAVESNMEELNACLKHCDVVVDAIFGTGFRGEIGGSYKEAISLINSCRKHIISVDIPSGICSDTGEEANVFVKADVTVTFCCKKPGHVLGTGRTASGQVVVRSISIPEQCILKQEPYITTNDEDYPTGLIRQRNTESHKGDYGRVCIIAGSYSMSGAAALCSKAALRAGSGLVTCALPESIIDRVGSLVPEVTFITFNESEAGAIDNQKLEHICSTADVVAIGPGTGRGIGMVETMKSLLERFKGPIVIDADGINILAEHKELLDKLTPNTVLTPHPGEMSSLTGIPVIDINAERMDIARRFAKQYNCILLLKGSSTVVSNGRDVYINTSGNPGMATGGSGDVLTGIIASLCGQRYEPWNAAVLGCYIHGCAGDAARDKYGYGLTAGDIVELISL